jgi:hypothetical protein
MAKDFTAMEDSNGSFHPSIHGVSDPARRTLLRGGLGAAAAVVDAASLRPCTGHRLGLGRRVDPAVDGDVSQRHAAPRRLLGWQAACGDAPLTADAAQAAKRSPGFRARPLVLRGAEFRTADVAERSRSIRTTASRRSLITTPQGKERPLTQLKRTRARTIACGVAPVCFGAITTAQAATHAACPAAAASAASRRSRSAAPTRCAPCLPPSDSAPPRRRRARAPRPAAWRTRHPVRRARA